MTSIELEFSLVNYGIPDITGPICGRRRAASISRMSGEGDPRISSRASKA